MKYHTGKLTITRPTSGDGNDQICISLIDATSSTECVEIYVSPHDFAMALTSFARQPCKFEWRPDKVGLVRQVKNAFVPVIGDEAQSVAPYEVDGWKALRGCFGNHHRGNRDTGYLVNFERYVEPTEEDIV